MSLTTSDTYYRCFNSLIASKRNESLTDTEYNFLKFAAFGMVDRLRALVEQKNRGEIQLRTEITDKRGCIYAYIFEYEDNYFGYGMNALHLACVTGQEKTINFLIENFPNLLIKRSSSGETPLFTLVRELGRIKTISDDCFKYFLSFDVSMNALDKEGHNMFDWLSDYTDRSGDDRKLRIALDIFKRRQECYREEFLTLNLTFLPTVIVKHIIAEYLDSNSMQKEFLNIYSKHYSCVLWEIVYSKKIRNSQMMSNSMFEGTASKMEL